MKIGERTDKIKHFSAFLVGIITFLIFLTSLQNDFVEWDDSVYIFENPNIGSLDATFFKWAFFDFYGANWHPLTWISHALDYAVWGLNPLGHHLTSNILHAVNSFLVVLLVVRLIEAVLSRQPSSSRVVEWSSSNDSTTQQLNSSSSPFTIHDSRLTLLAATTTGLLFGLHPLHVESVAWVAERKDLLCALFFLLSVMMYTGYVCRGGPIGQPKEGQPYRVAPTQNDPRHSIPGAGVASTRRGLRIFSKHYLLALVFFILALLSKPMAVSLPLVLLILDWYPFNRIRSFKTFRTAFIEKLPFIVLSIISSILTVLAQEAGGAVQSIEAVPFSSRILVAANSLLAYLWQITVPINLIPYYPYPTDVSFFTAEYFFSSLVVIGATLLSLVIAKKQKIWFSVWGYYVVTLLPVLGVVQVGGQAMADRYAYLPSAGLFLLCGAGGAWVYAYLASLGKHGLVLKLFYSAAVLSVLVSLSYLTIKQIDIWKNSEVLWNYVIDKEPSVYFAYNNRGITYYAKGQLDEAIADYKKAITLNPQYLNSHYNLGLAFLEKGWLDQAIGEYQIVVRLNPRHVKAHLHLGVAYSKKGLADKSIEEYRIVESLKPGSAEPFFQLGSFFTSRGLLDEAIEQLQIAIRLRPDFAEAHNYIATAFFRKGRTLDALDHYLIYAKLNPNNAVAHLNLGSAYAATGSYDRAIEHFQIAIRLNPDLVDAHYNLGMAYQTKGMMDQAVEHLEAAARLNPADAVIRNDLARAYSLKKTAGSP